MPSNLPSTLPVITRTRGRVWLALPLLALAPLALGLTTCADIEDAPPVVAPQDIPPVPAQSGAQRLTIAQYRNAIHAIFGDDVAGSRVEAALQASF